MGWVIKELRTELADAMLEDAEREARRIRRAAGRTTSRVADDLRALEALAVELHATVRRQRLSTVAPAPDPDASPARVAPAEAVRAPKRRRGGRASMRSSPLDELLRASGSGRRFPRALLDARS
jgi:hypothetical protein